jgi:hypothetical protein
MAASRSLAPWLTTRPHSAGSPRPAGSSFVSNAGSASETGYSVSGAGQLTLLTTTPTDPGTVDAAATPGGQFLYVQTGGNGVVDEFAAGSNGALTEIGSVTVADAVGGEGIAAQ